VKVGVATGVKGFESTIEVSNKLNWLFSVELEFSDDLEIRKEAKDEVDLKVLDAD
jgi:hypothetical protein